MKGKVERCQEAARLRERCGDQRVVSASYVWNRGKNSYMSAAWGIFEFRSR